MYHSEILNNENTIIESPVSDLTGLHYSREMKPLLSRKLQLISFRLRMFFEMLNLAFSRYGFRKKAFQKIKEVVQLGIKIRGELPMTSMRLVDGKISGTLYVPPFPSPAFSRMIQQEFIRSDDSWDPYSLLQSVFIAITKKCPLNCEHCFEWDNLNKKEVLSYDGLDAIVAKFISAGVTKVFLSGGEPMLRNKDIEKLVAKYHHRACFWVLTSGFNCTKQNLLQLKQSGLTGIVVSLDHYEETKHDRFRGFKGSYKSAIEALANARETGLFTAISTCCSRDFISENFLLKMTEIGGELGVDFIQFLEPKKSGRYRNQDVLLSPDQLEVLENFVLELAANKNLWKYPRPMYHGIYQRKYGCLASGVRSLYVDTDGDYHACPFSERKRGSALNEDVLAIVKKLRSTGCGEFLEFNAKRELFTESVEK